MEATILATRTKLLTGRSALVMLGLMAGLLAGVAARHHPLGILVLAVGTLSAFTAFAARRPDWGVALAATAACFSERLFAFAAAHGLPPSVTRLAIASKDVIALGLIAALITQAKRSGARAWILTALAGVIAPIALAVLAAANALPFQARILGARDLIEPAIGLATGLLVASDFSEAARRKIVVVVVLATTLSLIEYTLPWSTVEHLFHVGTYYSEVKQQTGFLYNGIPGNYFTDTGARRLSGTFGDPLAAGYAIAIAFTLIHSIRGRDQRRAASAVLAIGLILTFTRASWLIAGAYLIGSYAAPYIRKHGQMHRQSLLRALYMLFIGLIFTALLGVNPLATLASRESSTVAHLWALRSAFNGNYHLIGAGPGSAGAAVASQRSLDIAATGSESSLSAIILQLGIAFGLVYLLSFLRLVSLTSRLRFVHAGWWFATGTLLVTGLISQQLLTFNSGWFTMLVIGLGLPRSQSFCQRTTAGCTPEPDGHVEDFSYGLLQRGEKSHYQTEALSPVARRRGYAELHRKY